MGYQTKSRGIIKKGKLKTGLSIVRDRTAKSMGRLLVNGAARRIREAKPATISEMIDFAFGFRYGGISIAPQQNRYEIRKFLEFLSARKIKSMIEIGTSAGGTLFLLSRISDKNARIISVDLPGGKGGGYDDWRMPLYEAFAAPGQRMSLVRADSHQQATADRVGRLLGNKKVDFLFIDGDHTYDGAKKDFTIYRPLVRDGGIIAFHDVVQHPKKAGCEVKRLFDEVKRGYRHKEIIENPRQGWAGIGIIFNGPAGRR